MLWIIAGVAACLILGSLPAMFFDEELDKPSDRLKSRIPHFDYDDDE